MDLTTIVAFVAALGGSAGLAALVKAIADGRTSAKQVDLNAQQVQIDNLCKTIEQLQDENARLASRVEAYESTIVALRDQIHGQALEIDELRKQDKESRRQIGVLRRELTKAQHRIADLVLENVELKAKYNGETSTD